MLEEMRAGVNENHISKRCLLWSWYERI